jgi:dipeptidyl-peptidase-4
MPIRRLVLFALLSFPVQLNAARGADDLLTVAESSDYRATSTSEQVRALLQRLDAVDDEAGDVMRLGEIGRSTKDQPITLAVIADPPVETVEQAQASGKPIVLVIGNIHAGEVCGKEASLMLARELVTTNDHPLLDDLVMLLVPNYNPDGNDAMSPDNRPGQVGPELGMGERPNAQGYDLNRDWVKLEAPETRALVALLTEWDPHIVIDTHTTNGSRHRYTLTYAEPTNPSGYQPSIAFLRDELLPSVTQRLRDRTGYDTFFYGNFNREHTVWRTYSADPRFGGPYRGLRGHMSILSEAYAYAPYKDRVLCTLEFLREIMRYAAEHGARISELHAEARRTVTEAGRNPQPDDLVGLRHRHAAFPRPVMIKGYGLTEDDSGRSVPTNEPAEHRVVHVGRFEPTVSVTRPYAYIIDPGLDGVIEKLRQHGIEVEPFDGEAIVERYSVTKIDRAKRKFQGHRLLTLDVEARDVEVRYEDGAMIVRTAQPLGTLAVYLLEPRSADGLAAWNFLDDHLAVGAAYPIARVRSARDLQGR